MTIPHGDIILTMDDDVIFVVVCVAHAYTLAEMNSKRLFGSKFARLTPPSEKHMVGTDISAVYSARDGKTLLETFDDIIRTDISFL